MRAHVSCTGCCASDLFEAVQVVSWHHVRELVVAQGTDEKGEHLFLRGGTAAADSEGAAAPPAAASVHTHLKLSVSGVFDSATMAGELLDSTLAGRGTKTTAATTRGVNRHQESGLKDPLVPGLKEVSYFRSF